MPLFSIFRPSIMPQRSSNFFCASIASDRFDCGLYEFMLRMVAGMPIGAVPPML